MTFDRYQVLAARTMNTELTEEQQREHALCGMVSELGEICGIFQKAYQGHPVDYEHVMSEMGDLFWFAAEFCTATGNRLESVAEHNVEKLLKRYPDGFDAERSLHRAEGDI